MTNLRIIELKIKAVKQYLAILNKYRKYSQKKITADDTLRGAVERYLYLAVQAFLDLAEAVIAYKKIGTPETYQELFEILKNAKLIKKDLAEKLKKMAGFRNILAHDYAKIDYDLVYIFLKDGLIDIKQFINVIQKKIY